MKTFRIDQARLTKLGNEVVTNVYVLAEMRKRGIPVLGKISIQGVTNGVLTMQCDDGFVIYTWTPGNTPDDDEL